MHQALPSPRKAAKRSKPQRCALYGFGCLVCSLFILQSILGRRKISPESIRVQPTAQTGLLGATAVHPPLPKYRGALQQLPQDAATTQQALPIPQQQQQAQQQQAGGAVPINPLLQQFERQHQQLLDQATDNHQQMPTEQRQQQQQMLDASTSSAQQTAAAAVLGNAAQQAGGAAPAQTGLPPHLQQQLSMQHPQQTQPHQPEQQQLPVQAGGDPKRRASLAALRNRAVLHGQRLRWPDGYLAVCVVVKDQPEDLRYWLEYHKWIGVDKFYVFDHNSSQPAMPAVFDHIQAGTVEYQYFVGHPRTKPFFTDSNQFLAYQRCMMQHWRRHRWLAFIDADEFLVIQPAAAAAGVQHLGMLLAQYDKEGVGGLGVNWVLFGSSGLLTRPPAGPLASYSRCVPQRHEESRHVKVIANTRYLHNMGVTPHDVQLRDGAVMVNEQQQTFTGPKTDAASWDKIALYHYVLKSRQEFDSKTARGSGAGNTKTIQYWDYLEALATDTCSWGQAVAQRFLAHAPKLQYCTQAFQGASCTGAASLQQQGSSSSLQAAGVSGEAAAAAAAAAQPHQ